MERADNPHKLQMHAYGRELVIVGQRLDANEAWKLIPIELLHIMHELVDNPPVVGPHLQANSQGEHGGI